MNHHMGQAAGLVEPLDERVTLYLKEIIRNGCRRVKELQSRASEFVREKIFHGERPPESLRRRFNPNRKKVRYLITRVKLETRHSKIDQENVAKQTEEWARCNQVFFSRLVLCAKRFVLEMIGAMNKRNICFFISYLSIIQCSLLFSKLRWY